MEMLATSASTCRSIVCVYMHYVYTEWKKTENETPTARVIMLMQEVRRRNAKVRGG